MLKHILPLTFVCHLQSSESSDLSDGPITVQEFMEVKSALTASEAKIQQLLKVNCHLSEELRMMQSKVSETQGGFGLTLSYLLLPFAWRVTRHFSLLLCVTGETYQ